MNKIFFLLGFFMSTSLASSAQQLDSLEKKLKETLPDSSRVYTMIKLASEYQYVDIRRSIQLCEEAARIAEGKKLEKLLATSYIALATYHGIQGNNTSSSTYNSLALNISIRLKDSVRMALSYNNLGTDYQAIGKFDEAYFYFTQCYRVAHAASDSLNMSVALHNIASVFKELGQYERAISYLMLSKKISIAINDLEGLPYTYDEMGDIYLQKGLYDSALWQLNESLNLTRKQKLRVNELEPNVISKIAEAYFFKQEYEKALAYYDTAYQLHTKTGNQFGLAKVDMGKGLVFLKQKNFKEAQKLFEKSATVAHRFNALKLEIECNNHLADLHEQKGDFKTSLSYFKRYKTLEDSLFSAGMQSKLLQDQVRFETESKDEQIKSLTQLEEYRKVEIKKQELIRNILVVAVALTVILLFTVYRSGQRRVRINKLLVDHQEDIKKRSIELEQLNQVKDKFFSIISHDLRSPINALSGILDLLENKQLKPGEFEMLTKELRIQFNHTKTLINNLLDWALLQMDKLKMQPERVNVHDMVNENFKLLGSLHLKEIKMVNEVAPSIYALADINTINLVFRNLILNGIKFTDAGGQITIACEDKGQELVVAVKDNGVGIAEDVQKILFEKTSGYTTRGTANEKGTGLGLILCKEFVEKNGGRIWLESAAGKGSTFYFTLKKSQ